MDSAERVACADMLYAAMRAQETVAPLTETHPDISIDDAYSISRHWVSRRVDEDGERIVGKKIGVTSDAVQRMLGVFQPDFGFLTDAMAFGDGAEIVIAEHLIQPRAEAEIGFRLRSELLGPGVDEAAVLSATDYVVPCFEIVDSRIRNWEIQIQDTIADNASCGVYVLGEGRADPRALNLPALGVAVEKNGVEISRGVGAAVQGDPLTAVAWLANTLGRYGIALEAGEMILSGSLVPLEPATSGDRFAMRLEGVGRAAVRFA